MATQFSVLVVDDQPSMTSTLSDILDDEGYHVEVAHSGEEALEMCHEQQFDIVLMDVRMPGLNGNDTFRLIKTFSRATSVILMSAYSIVNMKREALQDGAVAVLQKPLDIEQVLTLIRQCKRPPLLLFMRDRAQREHYEKFLKDNRYRSYSAGSVHEALELAGQIRFNTVIFDQFTVADKSGLFGKVKKFTPTPACIVSCEAATSLDIDDIDMEYTHSCEPGDIEGLLEILQRIEQQHRSELLS